MHGVDQNQDGYHFLWLYPTQKLLIFVKFANFKLFNAVVPSIHSSRVKSLDEICQHCLGLKKVKGFDQNSDHNKMILVYNSGWNAKNIIYLLIYPNSNIISALPEEGSKDNTGTIVLNGQRKKQTDKTTPI